MAKNKMFKRVQPTQTNEQLISNIDEMLKRNRGGFSAQGFDVDSTFTPYKISDVSVGNPYGVNQNYSTPNVSQVEPTQTTPIETQPYQYQEQYGNSRSLAKQFIQQFNQAVNPVNQAQSSEEKQLIQQETNLPFATEILSDGGILHSDGIVRYDDGTVRQFTDSQAIPIQTMTDGSIRYSDGSIRKIATTGEFLTQENISYADSGFNGLVYGIFGENSPRITQGYGNYNPGMGYYANRHRGTDFSGINSNSLSLPTDAQVVEVTNWDGQSRSGQQAYGNSVLVMLKTGEMLRFSHLADPVQFAVGEVIPAMTTFGTIGSTGNSTGPHLDLEYYDAEGNIGDPSNFSGFGVNRDQFTQDALQGIKRTYEQESQNQSLMEPQQRQEIQQNQQQQETFKAPQTDIIQPQYQNTELREKLSTPQAVGRVLGQGIENINPTGNFDLGVSELLAGKPTEAAEKIEQTNPTGTFDLGITERLSGNKDLGNQALSGTLERTTAGLPTRNRFDLGISEALRGDVEGSKAVRQQTGQNIEQKIQEGLGNAQTFITDFLKELKLDNLPKPGEGIVKQAYAADQSRPSMADLGSEFGTNKIGSSPNSSMTSPQPQLNMGKGYMQGSVLGDSTTRDTRDPFFKEGTYKQYADYLPENADEIYGGALNTGLFDKSFFERRTAQPDISNVFGGTYMEGEANNKFTQYRNDENKRILDEWRSRYQDTLRYNQDEVNRLYQQLSRPTDDFLDLSEMPKPSYHEPTLDEYLRAGKSIAEWYAETGRQGELDAQGGPENAMKNYQEQKEREAKAAQQGSSHMSSESGFTSSGGYTSGGGGGGGGGSWGPTQTYSYNPSSSNYSSSSGFSGGTSGGGGGGGGGGSISSFSEPSIFDRVKNLFQRIF